MSTHAIGWIVAAMGAASGAAVVAQVSDAVNVAHGIASRGDREVLLVVLILVISGLGFVIWRGIRWLVRISELYHTDHEQTRSVLDGVRVALHRVANTHIQCQRRAGLIEELRRAGHITDEQAAAALLARED